MGKLAGVYENLDAWDYAHGTVGLGEWAIGELLRAVQESRSKFRLIASMAGHPDPEEGCRLIISECKKVMGEQL